MARGGGESAHKREAGWQTPQGPAGLVGHHAVASDPRDVHYRRPRHERHEVVYLVALTCIDMTVHTPDLRG